MRSPTAGTGRTASLGLTQVCLAVSILVVPKILAAVALHAVDSG